MTYLQPLFQAAYPSIPIVFDNSPFDWNKTPDLFVEVELEFFGGSQVGISSNPKRRVSGYLYFTVYARAGTGTRESLRMVDWFNDAMKFSTIGGCQWEVPEPDPSEPSRGYYLTPTKVSFRSNPG